MSRSADKRIKCGLCHATFYERIGQCPNCRWVPPRPGPPDLSRTRKMILWLDRTDAKRQRALDLADTEEKALAALAAFEAADNAVRKAFHLDTNDRNSLDNCMIVDVSWLRKISDPNYKFVTRRPK